MNGLKTLRKRGLALAVAFLMCLSLLPIQARAADATVTEGTPGSNYSMSCTIIYHSNYPNGEDKTYTVDYKIYATYPLSVRSITLKTFDELGFTVPTGYTLNNINRWNVNSDGSSAEGRGTQTFNCKPGQTYNIYAQYTATTSPVVTYTLTYMDGAAVYKTVSVDKDTAVAIEAYGNTKDGYTFTGWDTDPAAKTVVHAPGDKITLNTNTTLYAVWEQNLVEKAALTYMDGTTVYKTVSVDKGTAVTIEAYGNTKDGYTFTGWDTDPAAKTVVHKTGGQITLNADTTLYAVWEQNSAEKVTLTYMDGTAAYKTVSVDKGTAVTIEACGNTKDGYTFKGWDTSSAAKTVVRKAGDQITLSADTVLYAVWEKQDTSGSEVQGSGQYSMSCAVVYHSNYPNGTDIQKKIDYTIRSSYNIAAAGTNVSLKAFSDLGFTAPSGYTVKPRPWNTTASGSGNSIGDLYFCSNNDTVHLYAQYTANSVPSVTRVTLTCVDRGQTYSTATYDKGASITLPGGANPNPGRVFKGWDTSPAAKTAVYAPGARITISSSLTLYAVWEQNSAEKAALTYMDGTAVYKTVSVDKGTTVTIEGCANTKDGYTFKGWDTSSAAKTVVRKAGDQITLNADTVLYAVWEKQDTSGSEVQGSGQYSMSCAVVYHSNYPNGTDIQKKIDYTIRSSYNIAATGTNVSLKAFSDLGFTVPSGYTVKPRPWNTTASGGGDSIGSIYFCSNNDTVHLYAQYSAVSSGGSSSSGSGSSSTRASSGTPSYSVKTAGGDTQGGTVKLSSSSARPGDTVTLTVTPKEGYEVRQVTVKDRNGKTVSVIAQGSGKYTFTMPGGQVTVDADFQPAGAAEAARSFTDIDTGAWYYDAIRFVTETGLMDGYGDGTFGPGDSLSRAMLAQILYNHAGRPSVSAAGFTDVDAGAWYADAVSWAAEKGIVKGYGSGVFGSNDSITREQLAVTLWRYSGSPAATSKELYFSDADESGGYALEALRWAVENGIVNGYGDGRLGPKGQATRAQAAQMLTNFLKNQ